MEKVQVKVLRGVVGEEGVPLGIGEVHYVTRPFAAFLFHNRKAEPYEAKLVAAADAEAEKAAPAEKPAKTKGKR